jgi:antitoxin component of MazEF toxin-antitoxin module
MVKVQSRKIGEKYEQFWIPLPKKVCESLRMGKGDELEVFVENGDIVLKKSKKKKSEKKETIDLEALLAKTQPEERKELIEDAFEKGELPEDMYREFGEWGWV